MSIHRDLAETRAQARFVEYVGQGVRSDPFYPGDKAFIDTLTEAEVERQKALGIRATRHLDQIHDQKWEWDGVMLFLGCMSLVGAVTVAFGVFDIGAWMIERWVR